MKTTLLSLLASVCATSVMASGPYVPHDPPVVPPAPIVYDWSGPYAGLHVGVPIGDNTWAERGAGAAATPGDWDGTPWGLTVGIDRQRGNLVYGAALDYTGGSMMATSTTSGTFNCLTGCMTEVTNSYAVRGRIGRAMDRTLVYVTAGVAGGNAEGTVTGLPTVGSDSLTGWVAGIGIEQAISQRLSLNLEYLYTDLGRLELPNGCTVDCYTDVTYGTIRLGANFRW